MDVKPTELKSKTIMGAFWNFAQKALNQSLQFIVTIILARKLMPEDYGVVAIAGMFIVLLGIFINGGMGVALVQKKDADDLDFSTIFYTGLVASLVMYLVVFFSAPIIAKIYGNYLLVPILRVLSLGMPIGALSTVQNALLSRQLDFKKFFKASLSGRILSALVGIYMAFKGFGAWALVGQQMVSNVTNTIVVFYMIDWHPHLRFSFDRFKVLFSFSWKKMAADFIGTFCSQLKGYIIGFKYTTADLAFYNRGEGLPQMVRDNFSGPIDAVLFPALSRMQESEGGIKRGLRRTLKTSSYILFPLLFGLAAISDQLVPILYSSKWNPAIPFMQLACVTYAMVLLNNANLQAILAKGRSDLVLKLEIYKKPVMLSIIAVTTFISPVAISAGMLVYSFYVLYVNSRPNIELLDYSMREQLRDVLPNFIISALMAIIVYLIGNFFENMYVSVVVQILLGGILYLIFSKISHNESFEYVRVTVSEIYVKKVHRNEK